MVRTLALAGAGGVGGRGGQAAVVWCSWRRARGVARRSRRRSQKVGLLRCGWKVQLAPTACDLAATG